jgi:hypothetical protein
LFEDVDFSRFSEAAFGFLDLCFGRGFLPWPDWVAISPTLSELIATGVLSPTASPISLPFLLFSLSAALSFVSLFAL